MSSLPISGRFSSRREFIAAAGTLVVGTATGSWLRAGERPPVSQPRATSGDTASEPDWLERLTITVGPSKADLVGTDDRLLQAAVDYVSRLGAAR